MENWNAESSSFWRLTEVLEFEEGMVVYIYKITLEKTKFLSRMQIHSCGVLCWKLLSFFFTFEPYSFDWKQYLTYKESIIFSISSNLLQAYWEMAAYQKYQRYEKYQIYSCLKVHLEPYPELRTGFYGQFVLLRNLQWLAFASYAVKPYDAKVLSACHEKIF